MPDIALPLGEPLKEPAPSRGFNQPPPASVTVTIGRIEVEVAPAPTAPAAPRVPVRTRGFDAYTRARRGQLR
jgi:hypothetical protein